MTEHFRRLAEDLTRCGSRFYDHGWMFGTGGNLSAVISSQPLRLAITPSGSDKATMRWTDILEVDSDGDPVREGAARPSAETPLHIAVVRSQGAGAVFHTHSVAGTLVADSAGESGGIWIEGYEMLKGLEGVSTHEHREWLPVVENSQDMADLGDRVESLLAGGPRVHGFLVRRHGLYTWGRSIPEARRHVEILEFLMQVAIGGGRRAYHLP